MDEQVITQQVETQNIQDTVGQELQQKSRPAYGRIVLAILAVLAMVGYWGYVAGIRPYVIVGKAMGQLATYDSAQVVYSSPDENLKIKFEGAGEEKPAKFGLTINKLRENKNDSLEISGIFTKKDIYAQAKYSEPEIIEKSLVAIYPLITKTQTYKLASSVWQGSEWLHLAIPESETGKTESAQTDWSDPEMRKVAWNWYWAVKPGKVEKNYPYQGESYTKVSFGFRKDQLIKAINGLKDLDIEMKVSQINSMIEVVESSDDWDRELVTFLIDKKGDLRVVTLQVPEIKKEVLDKSISEGLAEQEGGAMLGGLVGSAKEMIWGSKGDMVELGVIKFGQFNEVEEIKIPENLVEATDLMAVAQAELGPIFAQMMGARIQGVGTPSTTTPMRLR